MSGPSMPDWDDEPALLDRLGRALGYDPSAVPPEGRVQAIRAAAGRMGAGRRNGEAAARLRSGSRRLLLAGGVAAGFGGVVGYGVAQVGDERASSPPEAAGVPTETIAFEPSAAADVTTSELVNHTWGTELILDLTGLDAGTAYDVVYETGGGDVTAGSLLAVAAKPMRCRFNAAPLRADVLAIEVRGPAGEVVLRSELRAV